MADFGAGNNGTVGRPPLLRSFRSNSRPRRTASFSILGHCMPVPFPSGGDGASGPISETPSQPPGDQGITTLLTSSNTYQLQHRRRSSSVNKERTIPTTFQSPKVDDLGMDLEETPIHQISKAAIAGLSNLMNSDTLKKTASSIFISAARIGSEIFNRGMTVASNILGDAAVDISVKEDTVTCKGYTVKTQGNALTLRSVHLDPTEIRVRIQLGSELTSTTASSGWVQDVLTLTFQQSGNTIGITPPSGSSFEDISWDTSEDGQILSLYLQ